METLGGTTSRPQNSHTIAVSGIFLEQRGHFLIAGYLSLLLKFAT
jgi:hypothetical protein